MKNKTVNNDQEQINPLTLKLQKIRNNKDVSRLIRQAKQKSNNPTNKN